jgi:hypothetical protein
MLGASALADATCDPHWLADGLSGSGGRPWWWSLVRHYLEDWTAPLAEAAARAEDRRPPGSGFLRFLFFVLPAD